MAEFGEQLKKAREKCGYTQQTLSEKVYVARQTVSRWENGSRYPDLMTLKKLSSVLGVSADELLSEEDGPEFVGKTPVIEKPVVNNIMIAFYAVAVVLFAVQAVLLLTGRADLSGELKEGGAYAAFLLVRTVVTAGLFIFGFINLLTGTDTPKKSGIIILGFFALEALSGVDVLFYRVETVKMLVSVCFRIILPAVGCAGACIHFLSKGGTFVPELLVYFSSGFIIFTALYNLVTVSVVNSSVTDTFFILNIFLRITVPAAFIYQTRVLGLRKKRSESMSEK